MSSQWKEGAGKALMLKIIHTLHLAPSSLKSILSLLNQKTASILAKTCLYLDQERSHHTLKRQSFAQFPGDICSSFQKKISAQTLLPSPFPHTLPNLPATSSAPPATIHCSSHRLLSKSPTFAPSCSQPLRLVLMLVKNHMTSGLLKCYRH